MDEISCSHKIKRALCDCAEKMLLVSKTQEELILSQAIENLSRSLEILNRIGKEEGAER